MLSAREVVRNMPIYKPPLSGREGLRLDFNENTTGCSPRVLQRLRTMQAEELSRYPERAPLEALASAFLGIDRNELLLTNGIDEAIHLLCQTYLEPEDEVLIVIPTFSMYKIYASATGARVIGVPANGDNFAFPTLELLSRITPKTRLILVASPNNPSGALAPPNDLLRIVRSAPSAAVLVDEAYFEFCGETLMNERRLFPNLFVARTFSKAYGLAGLRIGILAGAAEQIRMVRQVSSPYNTNAAALACLPDALADQAYVRQYVKEVCLGRRRLEEELRAWGIHYWPSQANFILVRLGPLKDRCLEAMRERGVLVRDRSVDFGCEGCVRITIGAKHQMDFALDALRDVMRSISRSGVVPR